MKKRIGVVFYPDSINAGDDVQTLAMMQLVQRSSDNINVVLVDRENLQSESVKELDGLIISGWFMDKPNNWPPNNTNILYISFHVNTANGASKVLQSASHKGHFSQHAEIGCRDLGTLERFQKLGIDSYFSGCATLTIKPLSRENKRNGILAIDPFYKVENNESYQKWQLSRLLTHEELARCTFIMNDDANLHKLSPAERMNKAEKYLSQIQQAEFLITSRIHAALPAVAIGTPVFFIDAGYDRLREDRDRFDGIIDLFNVIDLSHFQLMSRRRWAKICRALGLHKLLYSGPKQDVLMNARKQTPPRINDEAMIMSKRIELRVNEFVKNTLDS
ncbi:MAG: polysaccharide pyruvyl transferase family protein [Bacteroidetes bacterium]|nr:polysaccharide pyruvyl transferase family protein [Bacteroidota bacterium]